LCVSLVNLSDNLDISAHAKSCLLRQFAPVRNSDSVDCYYYRPSKNTKSDVKSAFEYASVPMFLQTHTVCESPLHNRVVGEFIDDFQDFYSVIGDPGLGDGETKILLRFLIHSFPLKIEYQTQNILEIVNEHERCLKVLRMSIENALDVSFLGKLLHLDISDPLVENIGSLILKHMSECKPFADVDVNQLDDVYRCYVDLDFVMEAGVDSFNREFSLSEHEGIKIEIAGGYFLVSQTTNLSGLGISLGEDESLVGIFQERRFWMLVRLDHENNQARICFFSDILGKEERKLILDGVVGCIRKCTERVNRILLLNNLVCGI
jgi:hypothetical protein